MPAAIKVPLFAVPFGIALAIAPPPNPAPNATAPKPKPIAPAAPPVADAPKNPDDIGLPINASSALGLSNAVSKAASFTEDPIPEATPSPNTAPNTTLAVSFTAVTGAVFTCNVYPVFPSVGGTAPEAQTDSWAMLVDGKPADTFS